MSTPDYESRMLQNGQFLKIEAMHTKQVGGEPDSVILFPYLEDYSESFDSNWKDEDIYGRLDGISNYNNTRRILNFTIRVVAWDKEQAKENQFKISKLIRFLYPAISKKDEINNIRTAPILRLSFGSLVHDAFSKNGLYGYIKGGFNIKPLHKEGYFNPHKFTENADGSPDPVDDRRLIGASSNDVVIYWKYVDISFTFSVIHNHPLGEDINDVGNSRQWKEYFPYGIGDADFASAAPTPTNGSQVDSTPDGDSRLDTLEKLIYGDDPNAQTFASNEDLKDPKQKAVEDLEKDGMMNNWLKNKLFNPGK